MIDDYTPYDDIYLPVNSMIHYNMLVRAVHGLTEELNEADKEGFNTLSMVVELERIKAILYKMNKMVMRVSQMRTQPWKKLGISRSAYYYRRKQQFDGK